MSDPAARILVIDDEAPIRRFLAIALQASGYAVLEAADGRSGLALAATERPQLVILDLGLPDQDGKALMRALREWSAVPVLVLSVREAEAEKVAALDAGADDYVTKPFGVAELLARVRALLRARAAPDAPPVTIEIGPLAIDQARHAVTLAGQPVKLTRKEYELLRHLAQHAGRIVTHRQLLRAVWGAAHEGDTQYLRVFIRQLRQKLGDDPAAPRFILNEPGVGYRLLTA
jgi:two-component system KDP operon response regulator KdpE